MLRVAVGWLARGFGTALGAVGPESILATCAIMMFSTKYFFPKGYRRNIYGRVYSALTLLAAVAAQFWLPTLEPTYELGSFGKANLTHPPIVPEQLSRGELNASFGEFFRDGFGRRVILRGVNLAGSSKLPVGTSTHEREGFIEQVTHGNISFVGRPFALADADEHFKRLRAWGLTFVRFLVPWEAVEHKGPGEYDLEYLAYLREVVGKAAEYGISVFIDPHQDVWSRFTGGDGAPAWTLDKVGFNISALHESGASFTHQGHAHPFDDPLPFMAWPQNHGRLATATMFTLFFGGRDFAPNLIIDGENVQDFLQGHYFRAFARVAKELRGHKNVVGFDSLNEPHYGMIGWPDIQEFSRYRHGRAHSWFQAFQIGEGFSHTVEMYDRPLIYNGEIEMNPGNLRAWKDGSHCVWKNEGIWDVKEGEAVLLKPDHFSKKPDGSPVDIVDDYMVPFFRKFTAAIRAEAPDSLIFLDRNTDFEDPLVAHAPVAPEMEGVVWAPHWYDLIPLVCKSFRSHIGIRKAIIPYPVLGNGNLVKEYSRQLQELASHAKLIGKRGAPTLIGEIGIPMDMKAGDAFKSGNWDLQISAMDTTLQALDMALLSATIWNYTPDNSNANGDGWNGEDLSIFSPDQHLDRKNIYSGGRALPAVIRPIAWRTAGDPLEMAFDLRDRIFTFKYKPDPEIRAATLIFVPQYHYLDQPPVVELSEGATSQFLPSHQMLKVWHASGGTDVVTVTLSPAKPFEALIF